MWSRKQKSCFISNYKLTQNSAEFTIFGWAVDSFIDIISCCSLSSILYMDKQVLLTHGQWCKNRKKHDSVGTCLPKVRLSITQYQTCQLSVIQSETHKHYPNKYRAPIFTSVIIIEEYDRGVFSHPSVKKYWGGTPQRGQLQIYKIYRCCQTDFFCGK